MQRFDRLPDFRPDNPSPDDSTMFPHQIATILGLTGQHPDDCQKWAELLHKRLNLALFAGNRQRSIAHLRKSWMELRGQMLKKGSGFEVVEVLQLDTEIQLRIAVLEDQLGQLGAGLGEVLCQFADALLSRAKRVKQAAQDLRHLKDTDLDTLRTRLESLQRIEGGGFVEDVQAELGVSGLLSVSLASVAGTARKAAGGMLGRFGEAIVDAGERLRTGAAGTVSGENSRRSG